MIHHIHLLAALRLIHIGRAHQHRKMLLLHELLEDCPEVAPRQRIDPDGRLIQQQELRGAHQGAGQPELLLHAAG